MSEFLLYRENGVNHIACLCYASAVCIYDRKNKNNYPIKITKNNYGKIIFANGGKTRVGQILFAFSKELFPKDKHIDLAFLANEFYSNVKEILNKYCNFKEDLYKNDSLLVVSEKKAFEVFLNGFVRESNILSSQDDYYAEIKLRESLYNVHDEKFLVDTIDECCFCFYDRTRDIVTVNDDTYKFKYWERV